MGKSTPKKAGASKKDRTGDAALETVAELIKAGKARRVVVLTGAGISTSAGIPDFRSPGTGLYDNLQALNLPFPEAVFELGYFQENPVPFWTLAKEIYPGKHYPTPTHYFLHLLHKHQILSRVFTQNIDTLEHLSGLPPTKIIEAHGSFASAHCLDCGSEASTEYVLKSGVRRGEVVRCSEEDCDGLVKPDIVFFGEGLPDKFFKTISDLDKADLVIVIGTSLQVQPFSLLPNRSGPSTPRLLINREAVGPFQTLDSKKDDDGFEAYFARITGRSEPSRPGDLFFKGDADEGVWKLARALGWEAELEEMIKAGKKEIDDRWRKMEAVAEAERVAEEAEAEAEAGAVRAGDGEEGVAREEAVAVQEVAKNKEEEEGEKEASPQATESQTEDDSEIDALGKAVEQVKIQSKV